MNTLKRVLFTLGILLITISSCGPDPATQQAVDIFKQIQTAQDSIDAELERSREILEQKHEYDALSNDFRFDSIQTLEMWTDSLNRGDSIDLEVIIAAYDSMPSE